MYETLSWIFACVSFALAGFSYGRYRYKDRRPYVPMREDFPSEADYVMALDGWRRYDRRMSGDTV
jgi:hypothetical protein